MGCPIKAREPVTRFDHTYGRRDGIHQGSQIFDVSLSMAAGDGDIGGKPPHSLAEPPQSIHAALLRRGVFWISRLQAADKPAQNPVGLIREARQIEGDHKPQPGQNQGAHRGGTNEECAEQT